MSPRRPFLVVAGVLMVLAAVGCGGGDDLSRAARDRTSTIPSATPTSPVPTDPGTSSPPGDGGCPAIPPRAEPRPDRPRYVLRIDVVPADGIVRGDLTVSFTPDLPITELVFRLWPNGPRPALGGARLETGQVTVDGAQRPSSRADDTTLVVGLGRTVGPGTTLDIAMPWTLQVPGAADDRISRDSDAVRLGSFFPILPWEPGVGWGREAAVGNFAEASVSPTADFDLTVTVPPGYGVLASGEETPAGSNHFVATAMRDVAVSVGRFDDLVTAVAHAPDPVAVTVGVHSGVPGDARVFLDQVVAVLEDFGRRYGPYPWTTFTLAVTPGLGGGIEYPAHVMQGPYTEGDVTTHEVGHMWFYGLVGNDQGRDPWLDEGITSWAEATYAGKLDSYAAQPIPRAALGHLAEPMSFWALRSEVYGEGVYVQSAQALGALGPPDLVDCVLRLYVARNAHRVATPADVVEAAEAVFPDAEETLDSFGITP